MKRYDYIDVLKGIGIIFMIMGHIFFGYKFDYYIHAFNMPLFFLTSGYCYKQKEQTFAKMAGKEFQKLIVPYFLYGMFHYVIWILFFAENHSKTDPLKRLLFMNEDGLPIAGALWFLTALFWGVIYFNVIRRVIKNMIVQTIVIGIIAVIGTYYFTVTKTRLPWGMDIALVAIGFIQMGFLAAKYRDTKIVKTIFGLKPIIILAGLIINFFMILGNQYINMRTADYTYRIFFWINSVLSVILYLNLSIILCKFRNKYFLRNSVKILEYIGKNSLAYVGLNQLAIVISDAICYNMWYALERYKYILVVVRRLILLSLVLTLIFLFNSIKDNLLQYVRKKQKCREE